MKTIERAHMPKNLWERIKLPRNYYEKALELIDKHLLYWPKLLQHKVKRRLTKMTQMRIRMRKLALKTREMVVTTPRRQIKREARREEKALKAAMLDKATEIELLERLKIGIYPNEIYNISERLWINLLDNGKNVEEEEGIEYVEGDDELEEEEEEDMEDFAGFPSESYLEGDDHGTDLLPRTGVWWDLNTCPVPGGFDPHCVRGSIESALTKYVGESRGVTICAVGNLEYVSAELLRAISKSGMLIKHTPCRMRSLFILLEEWSKHTPPPANILLISSDSSWFVPDSVFVPSGYIVHRAFPENHRPSLRPPSSKGEKWGWETLLKDNSKGYVEKTSLSRPIDKPAWLCFICDMDDSFESCSSFVKHLKSEEHRQELYHSVRLDEEGVPVLHCKLCNYPGYDEFNMNIHYNSAQHKQKENEEEEKIKNDKNKWFASFKQGKQEEVK